MQWIEPIKEQLSRLEKRFEQLSTPGPAPLLSKLPRSAPSSRSRLPQSSSFSVAAPSPAPSASSPVMLSSNDFPPTSDDILEDETVDGRGMCVLVCVHVCVCVCV